VVPAGFRSWAEYEDKAVSLAPVPRCPAWPCADRPTYARGLLETSLGATDEMVTARLASRMERQRRVLMRDDRLCVVRGHQLSLYREVGSAKAMAEQMAPLATLPAARTSRFRSFPAVAHPAGASGFIVTDGAAYAEHVAGGFHLHG